MHRNRKRNIFDYILTLYPNSLPPYPPTKGHAFGD